MKNAIIYWFVFLAIQLIAGGIVQGIYLLWKSHDGIVPMAEMGCCVSPLDADTPLGGADMVCFGSLGIYHSLRMAAGADA